MSNRFLFIGIVLLTAVSMASADAQARTVRDLYRDCKSQDPAAHLSCVRFIEGTASVMLGVGELAKEDKQPLKGEKPLYDYALCPPDQGISGGQMRQAFINWAEKNPSEAQSDEGTGAWLALSDAWPCMAQRPR